MFIRFISVILTSITNSMSKFITASLSGGASKVKILIKDSFTWDEIVTFICAKLMLVSCSSLVLVDKDGDYMSPPITSASKFHKFCSIHISEEQSYFEVRGDTLSSDVHSTSSPSLPAPVNHAYTTLSKDPPPSRQNSAQSPTSSLPPQAKKSAYTRPPTMSDRGKRERKDIHQPLGFLEAVPGHISGTSASRQPHLDTHTPDIASRVPPSRPPVKAHIDRSGGRGRGRGSNDGGGQSSRVYETVGHPPTPITSGGTSNLPSDKIITPSISLHTAAQEGLLQTIQDLIRADMTLLHHTDTKGDTPLHVACSAQQEAVIEWLLEKGANVVASNCLGMTPLHGLCAGGLLSLIRKARSVNRRLSFDVKGDTDLHVLHSAAQGGHGEVITWLLGEEGGLSEVNIVNESGMTPLHFACWGNHLQAAKVLVQHGAHLTIRDSHNFSPIFYACSFGNVALVRWLLGESVEPHCSGGSMKDTPLHLACRNGLIDIAELLVQRGADVCQQNSVGATPLDKAMKSKNERCIRKIRAMSEQKEMADQAQHAQVPVFLKACALGHIEKATALLEAGMDINAVSANGGTGLHFAVRACHTEMCEFLVSKGAKANTKERHTGLTPLHIACLKGNADLAVWLLDNAGANALELSLEKRTTLHFASYSGCVDLIEKLLDAGVDINARNVDGFTPLHDCCSVEAASFLVKRGADPYAKTVYGSSAVHVACKYGLNTVVLWLLDNSYGNVNDRDIHGMTPFLIACQEGFLALARKLKDVGANVEAVPYAVKQKNTAVHFACAAASLPLLEWLLKDVKLNPNAVNAKGQTPYEMCVENDDLTSDMANWLKSVAVKYSIDISLPTEDDSGFVNPLRGATPLHGAAGLGDVDLLDRLIEFGAEVNARTALGLTPLHFASMQGQLQAAKVLVEKGADVMLRDRSKLLPSEVASAHNHIELFEWLRKKETQLSGQHKKGSGAAVASPSLFSCFPGRIDSEAPVPNYRGSPVVKGQLSSADSVSTAGTGDGDESESPGRTHSKVESSGDGHRSGGGDSLCDACLSGNMTTVQTLVSSGVSVDSVCTPGSRTPLHCAIMSGNMDVLQHLLSKNARVNVQNVGGMTPLHIACDQKKTEMALQLIKKGASTNIPNAMGNTPLHLVALHGSNSLLQKIIELPRSVLHNLDLCVKNSEGKTLMHIAAEQNNAALVDMLVAIPALVNARDEIHRTPLHYACKGGFVALAETLLAHEGFVNARDDEAMTPLLCACQGGHLKLAKLLVKHGASVAAESDEGGNALHYACRAGDMSMAKWLVKCDLDPNRPGHYECTPMQCVDRGENPQLLDWLLAWTLAKETGRSVEVILQEMRQGH